jgi:hypothetical protein
MSNRSRTLNQETSGLAGNYLFKLPSGEKGDSKSLDMRTRINSPETMKGMMYYGILGYSLGCDKALEIKDMMERLLISAMEGKGREEAVETLRQNLPKRVEVDKGHDSLTNI